MSGNPLVDSAELLSAQRALRDRLLGAPASSDRRRVRELAAEMLLYLDQPQACWQACLDWLLTATSADRIDAGYSAATHARYSPGVERMRADAPMPSVLGAAMDARDPGVAAVWSTRHVVVIADVATDPLIGPGIRRTLLAAQTRRKLAVALRDGGRDVGLLCADGRCASTPWTADECRLLDQVASEVVGPILGTSRRLGGADTGTDSGLQGGAAPAARAGLTPAELRVARLVLVGLSYKEIARQLDRSCATIDHQLRSMRLKLGVNSTAKLMRELAGLVPAAR